MPAGARRLLFISNGHGEDAIAAAIIRQLPGEFAAEAYPTLGDGRAYDGVCPRVGPRAYLPSEGWRNVRHSVLRDVFGGLFGTLLPGLKFFRSARRGYDRVIVVGDMIGVYGCFLTGVRNILYLDVYKTGYGKTYLPFERAMLRHTAGTVFCRAPSLAATLRAADVDARCAGNVMMDTIPRTGYAAAARRTRPLGLVILPGSRSHAHQNFALQVAALAAVPEALRPDLFLAVAGSLDLATLAAAAGLIHEDRAAEGPDRGVLRGRGLVINVLSGAAMGDALDASDLVLSQAGTATVQAIGLGRPAITFQAPGDRESRFRDEQRLFGEARQVVAADSAAIAERLTALLANDTERARLAEIGRERIGPPGAIHEIIAAI